MEQTTEQKALDEMTAFEVPRGYIDDPTGLGNAVLGRRPSYRLRSVNRNPDGAQGGDYFVAPSFEQGQRAGARVLLYNEGPEPLTVLLEPQAGFATRLRLPCGYAVTLRRSEAGPGYWAVDFLTQGCPTLAAVREFNYREATRSPLPGAEFVELRTDETRLGPEHGAYAVAGSRGTEWVKIGVYPDIADGEKILIANVGPSVVWVRGIEGSEPDKLPGGEAFEYVFYQGPPLMADRLGWSVVRRFAVKDLTAEKVSSYKPPGCLSSATRIDPGTAISTKKTRGSPKPGVVVEFDTSPVAEAFGWIAKALHGVGVASTAVDYENLGTPAEERFARLRAEARAAEALKLYERSEEIRKAEHSAIESGAVALRAQVARNRDLEATVDRLATQLGRRTAARAK